MPGTRLGAGGGHRHRESRVRRALESERPVFKQTTRMEDNELSVGHAKLVVYSHNLKSKYIKLSNKQQVWSGSQI